MAIIDPSNLTSPERVLAYTLSAQSFLSTLVDVQFSYPLS